jgi:GH24 family phage-related lysozyme (muramidase)
VSLEENSAAFVKQFEGYSPVAMWDVNAWRIGHGSDTLTLPDGTYRKVKQGDVTTPELAKKDLARRLENEFIPKARATIGPVYWDKLPEQAKVALISIAYNYGNITKQAIIDAARSGNMNELGAAIVDSTYNDNAGILRGRRAKEAALVKSAFNSAVIYTKQNIGKVILVFAIAIILIVLAILLFIYRKKIAENLTKV